VFALRTLSEPRVRRLVEIETEDVAVLAPGSIGPLGNHVAYVWVDHPTKSKIVVEVRVGDRGVDRREIAVRGLAGDVAARLVAIAISELVRIGMTPKPPPPPPPTGPRPPTPEEIERASRVAPAVVMSPEALFVGLPAARGLLGGAGLSLGYRSFGATQSIFGRWLAGTTAQSDIRWLEVGVALDYRICLGRSWSIGLGGSAALSSLHVAEARSLAGEPGERQTLSARAGGLVAIEARVARAAWLSLSAEPGAILRPTRFTVTSGAEGEIAGAWLGASLSMRFEKIRAPEGWR
jgi:hypothetical protein